MAVYVDICCFRQPETFPALPAAVFYKNVNIFWKTGAYSDFDIMGFFHSVHIFY